MDGSRFDNLAKSVAGAPTRRDVIKRFAIAVGGGAASIGLLGGLRGFVGSAAETCREGQQICRKDGDCCSEVCGPPDEFNRQRCECRVTETECGDLCCASDQVCVSGACSPIATSTATNTALPPTDTPTSTATSTPTDTPTSTATSTPTDTPTSTATSTPTDTPTNTATSTATNTPTDTPTNTATSTATNTPTDTPTNTATSTPTNTPTNTATSTPTSTPTVGTTVTPINCRDIGEICRKNGNCCSGYCGPEDFTRRRRCALPPT